MKTLWILFFTIVFVTCSENSSEWGSLFTKDSATWTILGAATWTFENDELIGSVDTAGGFVITKEPFDDFILTLEFFPDKLVNSGIFIRCGETLSPTTCYEINIWDDHINPDFRTGAVVGLAKPLANVETVGKWNTYKISAIGYHIQAWINGEQTVNIQDSTLNSGNIALQAFESGIVRFRKVRIKRY